MCIGKNQTFLVVKEFYKKYIYIAICWLLKSMILLFCFRCIFGKHTCFLIDPYYQVRTSIFDDTTIHNYNHGYDKSQLPQTTARHSSYHHMIAVDISTYRGYVLCHFQF